MPLIDDIYGNEGFRTTDISAETLLPPISKTVGGWI